MSQRTRAVHYGHPVAATEVQILMVIMWRMMVLVLMADDLAVEVVLVADLVSRRTGLGSTPAFALVSRV